MLGFVLTLPILLTAYLKDESVSGFTDAIVVYRLEEMGGEAFAASATISFPAAGEVRGSAPCNSYSAQQTVPYPWFEITGIAATRRACPDLAAETEFFATLQAMTLVEVAGDLLILSDEDGAQMIFRAAQD